MTPSEKQIFIQEIVCAVAENSVQPVLTADEHTWVKLAIKREAQSIKYRQAVIEKTLVGLAWMILLGLGYMLKEWATNHGFKP